MRRLILLSALIYGLIMVGIVTRNGILLALVIPMILYISFGLFYNPGAPQLQAVRQISVDRVAQDTPVHVKLVLKNNGPLLEEVRFEGFVPQGLEILEGEEQIVADLAEGETLELEHVISGKRGYYNFPEVQVTTNGHFNLISRKTFVEASASFYILPGAVPLKTVEIRPRNTRVYAGQVPARVGGPGVEFFGVRNYQAGDPLRWIDWRTTARHFRSVFTKTFEQEKVADVGLILDARLRSDVQRSGHALFEYSIQAAAVLAVTFLNHGNRVGLLLYGKYLDWTFPGYGKVQRERILQSLARAQQGESKVFEDLDSLPIKLFPAKSQIVLISPLLPDDVGMLMRLPARGYQLLIVSPDPVSYEESLLGSSRQVSLAARIARIERKLLLDRLREAGIIVLDWSVTSLPFREAAHAALSRTPFWYRSLGVET